MSSILFAAVSIGSAVTEMKVFEFTQGNAMREIECISTRINLGLDVYEQGRISREHVDELCSVLSDFKRTMKGYKVRAYRVFATSAFRESRNRTILCDYIEKQTGLDIDVFTNAEQRFADYQAICSVSAEFETILQDTTAIVDISSARTQISLFDKDKLITTQSLDVGNITTRERLLPLAKNHEHFERLVRELMEKELAGFAKLYQKDRQIRNLIVVGGNLHGLMPQLEDLPERIPSVTKEQFQSVYEKTVAMTPEEIEKYYQLPSDMSDAIVPSAIFCRCLMDNFGVDIVWLPDISINDGVAYDYGVRRNLIARHHSFDEDIIAAARNISKRYKINQSHVKNVEEIALKIFDKVKKIGGLGERDRLLLQISVILHSCGKFISLTDFSECAYSIILATEIIGLSEEEQAIVAYTVKYNTSPFIYYDELGVPIVLDWDEYMVVAKLTAILRLANALDCTHREKCQNVTVTIKQHELRISAESREDLSLEKGSFYEKADFFEEVFNLRPVFKLKKLI